MLQPPLSGHVSSTSDENCTLPPPASGLLDECYLQMRAELRKQKVDKAEAEIMTPRQERTTRQPEPKEHNELPTEHDALSHLMGCLGWRGLSAAAPVCSSWREAARDKLQEWAVLSHTRITGGAGYAPGQFSSATTLLETASHGVVILDAGNRRIQVMPAAGQACRVIDALVQPEEEIAARESSIDTLTAIASSTAVGSEAVAAAARAYAVGRSQSRNPTNAELLLARHNGRVPVPASAMGLATDDEGKSVLLGLSVEGRRISSGGFSRDAKREPSSGQILRVRLSDGALLGASGTPHTPAAKWLCKPAGLAVACELNTLFVSDAEFNCIRLLDTTSLQPRDGLLAHEFTIGHGDGLSKPHGLAIGGAERDALYVCDRMNHRLVAFTLAGERLHTIGDRRGDLPGRFSEPVGVVATEWRLYVAESAGRRLQVLSLIGEPMQVLKMPGERPLRSLALAQAPAFGKMRLWASADQGGLHLVTVGTAALAPP